MHITPEYFKLYRRLLGFGNQADVKAFFQANDVPAGIDYGYMESMNARLEDIVTKISSVVHPSVKPESVANFCSEYIYSPYEIMRDASIIQRLNNQGRRCEEVYFSWMRGYIISNFFAPSIASIFDVSFNAVNQVGDDDLRKIETFKRTPKADLEIDFDNGSKMRIEVQSGFTGINDIKQHKVLEARRLYDEEQAGTVAIHFDLFNGQVAMVPLHTISESDQNWITRQQMEGQTVLNIEQNRFLWKLTDAPPSYKDFSSYA